MLRQLAIVAATVLSLGPLARAQEAQWDFMVTPIQIMPLEVKSHDFGRVVLGCHWEVPDWAL